MEDFIHKLESDFPDLVFKTGSEFCWSPARKEVIYNLRSKKPTATWSLLHEVGHALLGHLSYTSDFELLSLEVAAWQKACELGKTYNYKILEEHVQNCLDTYRDWLHQRSTCPVCSAQSLQTTPTTYECLNCHAKWQVTTSRFCRPYRLQRASHKIEKPPMLHAQTTFL